MTLQKGAITVSVFIIILCAIPTSIEARSVYAIPKHTDKTLNVYDVLEGTQEGQLEYRATYQLNPILSPTDVVIDDKVGDILFVTSEFSFVIQLINARTFQSEGEVIANGASDLAGVELDYVDQDTTLLYTVDRGTNKLFVYDWDAEAKELTLLPYSPSQDWYTLLPYNPQDADVFACGLALDEADGILYASQLKRIGSGDFVYSNIVYAYEPECYFGVF